MENKLFTEERRDDIVRTVNESGSVSVAFLVEKYQVSGTTIRIDLSELEKEGKLKRAHGGAVSVSKKPIYIQEPLISERAHFEEKQRIGREALSFLSPNETILIDTGTTMVRFAQELAQSDIGPLTIYSNDLLVLEALEANARFELHMLGGRIRNGFHYSYGAQVVDEIRRFHFKKLFLAPSAINKDGFTTPNGDLALMKKAMMASAEQIIVLADSSKFDLVDFENFGTLHDVHAFVTDRGIPSAYKKILNKTIQDVRIV